MTENISNVLNVFFNGFNEHKQIINKIIVDEKLHKHGLINIAKNQFNRFILDDENKKTINLLFHYFTGNEEKCFENDIDLSKGLLIVGGTGTGKSLLFKIFKLYTGEVLRKNSYQFYNSSEIVENVNINGVKYLEKFNYNFDGKKANPITCYIDDICSKNEKIKHFGSEISVIESLINIRYNIFLQFRKLTHFTSNIYPSEISKYYDLRIISRLTEMCNVIELNGIDRRI